jgi:PAS domain S-box-containing protein
VGAARVARDDGLLQALPWAVFVCDPGGVVTAANDAAAEVLGRPRDDLVGHSVHDISWWPPILLDAEERPIAAPLTVADLAAAVGGHLQEQLIGLAAGPGDPVIWLNVGAHPIVDAVGRVRRIVCSLTPAANGHRSTRQLWARAGRLRALLDDLPDTYFVIDQDARIIEWFGGGAPVLPGERKRIIGVSLADLLPPEYAEPLEEAIAEVRAGLTVTSFDVAVDDGDGGSFGEAVFRLLPDGLVAVLVRDVTERWRAEEELLALEENYRLLAENAHDVISRLRVSPVMRVDYVSPSVARVLGHPPEAFYADATLLFRLLRRDLVATANRIMAGEWDFDQPWMACYTHRDGREVWLEQSMTPIRAGDGTITAIDAVSRDVSERLASTERLRQSEARYRLLTEKTADVVWRVHSRPAVAVDYISAGITRLTGYSPEEFYADPGLMYRVVLEEQRGELRAVTAGDYDYAQPLVICLQRRDGTPVWLEMTMTAEYDDKGQFLAVHGVSRDITTLLRESSDLQRRAEQFRLLAEHARDVLWQLRVWPEVRLEYVSPSCERLLGHTDAEFLADQGLWWRLLAPECAALIERFNSGDFDADETLLLRWVRDDGSAVFTEGHVTPVRDASGRIVAIQGVARDVSDRLQAQRGTSE